ncbi:MAG: FAD-dependent oxidoreductase, partial [Myxococcota bacterium]
WQALVKRFDAPRLRQLFGRYATYVGSSPFEAPGTLNLIAFAEAQGVFRAKGGLRAVVAAMEALARELGVRFRHGTHVEEILVHRGRARGVRTAEGEHRADAVVFNGDVSALGRGLLGGSCRKAARPTAPDARSLSAFTVAIRGRVQGAELLHHNVFFSDDYRAEFRDLLGGGRVPEAPTVYVNAQDRAEGAPPEGLEAERFLVLVNAPPNGDRPERWGHATVERIRRLTDTMLERAGLRFVEDARLETTPVEFDRRFPGTGGSLYGPRSKGPSAVLSRVAAATKIGALYLAGGSVHPGAGVPMAAQSGRLAAEKVRADRKRR